VPFTPFHFGPSLLIGLIFFPLIYLSAILLGSMIVDLEPLSFLLLGLPVLHLFFHTFLGATISALILAFFVYLLRGFLGEIMTAFQLPQVTSPLNITVATLLGVYSHILLDAFLYSEMQPFWPLLGNPFLGLVSSSTVYLFCILCFIVAIPIYIFQIWRINRRRRNE
jgi:membrane-bound metal-dependent hydrolase YbcI (DUF457 family)